MRRGLLFSMILVVLMAAGGSPGEGAEWVKYFQTDDSLFFFDKESLTSPSANTRRALSKMVPANEGERQQVIKGRAELVPEKDYSGYAYTTVLEEIDCNTLEYCRLSRTDYGSGGPGKTDIMLSRWEWGRACFDDMWLRLVSGFPEAALYRAVCAGE
jgi:hypothetical protein